MIDQSRRWLVEEGTAGSGESAIGGSAVVLEIDRRRTPGGVIGQGRLGFNQGHLATGAGQRIGGSHAGNATADYHHSRLLHAGIARSTIADSP